jgi:predicted HD superfamily hydrolase involved in NAD metabolism
MNTSSDTIRIIKTIEARLPQLVTPRRLQHIRGVIAVALGLARRFNLDSNRIHLAAVAHDMDRERPAAVQLALVADWSVPLTSFERSCLKVIHGAVSAERLRRCFSLDDTEILDAVRHHTLGDPVLARQITPVGLVLYIADFCDPGRGKPDQAVRRSILDLESIPQMAMRTIETARALYGPLEEATERLYARLSGEMYDDTQDP